MKKLGSRGFTLVELLIATSVFSVILLVCTFGIIAVGRSYYKGVTISRTEEVARNVMDDVTQSIQFSGGSVTRLSRSAAGVDVYCIDNLRFSYILDKVLTDTVNDHVFVVDRPDAGCSAPQAIESSVSDTSKEYLLPNMHIFEFSITEVPTGSGLYKVAIKIASGPMDVFVDGDPANGCSNNRSDSQYCAIAELTSFVEKRLR